MACPKLQYYNNQELQVVYKKNSGVEALGTDFGATNAADGNDIKGWELVSSEGRIDTSGNKYIGGEPEVIHEKFKTKEELINSDIIKNGGYDKMLVIGKLTYKQVQTAMTAALSQATSYYHVVFSNCWTVVSKAMSSINLYNGGFTPVPNAGFYNIYYHYNQPK